MGCACHKRLKEKGVKEKGVESLIRRSWDVEVVKIYMEANFIADGVSNWVLTRGVGFYILSVPSVSLRSFLYARPGKMNPDP